MRVIAILTACAAFVTVAVSAETAASADAGRFLRLGGGGAFGVRPPPRTLLPHFPVRPARPRFGAALAGRCHGRPCFNFTKPSGPKGCPPGMARRGHGCARIDDALRHCPSGTRRHGRACIRTDDVVRQCPDGTKRRFGRTCVKVHDVVVNTCPAGTRRVRGRSCIKFDDVVEPCARGTLRRHGRCVPNDDVNVADPGQPVCTGRQKRRGKRCVFVGPLPPKESAPEAVIPLKQADTPPLMPGMAADTAPSAIPTQVRALTSRPHRPREIVVLIGAGNVAEQVVTDLMQRFSIVAEERRALALAEATVVRFKIVDNRPVEQVLAGLMQDPRVLLAQPNFSFETSDASGAFSPLPQYAPERIRAGAAHVVSRGRGVKVAIVDTGIDAQHPELAGAIAETFDALAEGAPTAETHGTSIAGIVAARKSLMGIAPEATILAVRAFADDGTGRAKSSSMALAKGIDWAIANKARLINMSFAGPDDPLLSLMISNASAKGAIFVAAMGNGGPTAEFSYPAAYPSVIAVTATDDGDKLFAQASRGRHVAIAAPGVDILAAALGGNYDLSSGTSLAAAHVSGVIALMLERNPALAADEVRNILARTARQPERAGVKGDVDLGAGLVDAQAAANATPAVNASANAQAAAE